MNVWILPERKSVYGVSKSKASGQTPYDVPGVRKSSGTTAAIFGVPEEILARTVFVLTEPRIA